MNFHNEPLKLIKTLKVKEPWHVFAIGDVHGEFEKLKKLMDMINARIDRFGSEEEKKDVVLIFLGDYVDRGPQSKEVVSHIMNMEHERRIIVLKGNHEEMACDMPGLWLGNGGRKALESYYGSYSLPEKQRLPEDVIEYFRTLLYGVRVGKFVFVHAGVNPRKKLRDNTSEDVTWIRGPFLNYEEPFGDKNDPVFVVHGHTPVPHDDTNEYHKADRNWKPVRRENRLNLDTGACFGGPLSVAYINSLDGLVETFGTND